VRSPTSEKSRGVIGEDWGYAIQKLDFLYAAALPGVRHDRTVNRAQSLRLGLEAIRDGAGERSFLIGCGSPLGPAIGVVDAMRIGADVTPYWSNVVDRVGGRGLHGLATRNAVMNILTRAVFDRSWWLNDPDCLMVRDTDTKLTEEEVRVLATVMGMTDGMLVISDRLARLEDRRRAVIGAGA
jgi:alpha-galactosidase